MSTIEKAAARLAERSKDGMTTPEKAGVEVAHGDGDEAGTALLPPGPSQSDASSTPVSRPESDRLDISALTRQGFVSPSAGRSQLAQEMRRIKRPLLLNMQKQAQIARDRSRPANLIMVTSALEDEGKSFISMNLALSLSAEMDRRVLLVDGDPVQHDISTLLGMEDRRGLCDLVAEERRSGEEAVLRTSIEDLFVLPSGGSFDHVDELYASHAMSELTASLAEADADRIVVFDAPPLLLTTEAAVLATRMGQVVVVVEANRTPQRSVIQALSQLEGCSYVSLILNKADHDESMDYGYGYRHKPESVG